jgi:glycosyltransferase involved in cell wall biosynthesis
MNVAERALAVLADRVIANAECVKEYVTTRLSMPPERVRVIYNGLRVERLTSGDPPGWERGAGGTVVMVASLTPKKDHATFLEAAALALARVSEARFVVVGDGPLRDSLVARAASLGIADRVLFAGSTTDVGAALRSADVSVLTSVREGCSNVLLESMALGVPVVVTDAGGNREVVEDGVTGFVVPQGAAAAVADRIVSLLGDRSLREKMGRAGRRRVLSRFGVDRMVRETVSFYAELVNARMPGLIGWAETAARRREGLRQGETDSGEGARE